MYIGDKIGNEFKTWQPGQIIVINAQTGSGKTYFILNTLLPYIAGQGQRMLYLSNRTALRDQVGQEFDPMYEDNICVMNYQKFEKLNLNRREYLSEEEERVNSCTYFVMDESHYFLSDAAFNGSVQGSLENIWSRKKISVLIFITATPEYLLLSLSASNIIDCSPPLHPVLNNIGTSYYECEGYFSDAPIIQRFSRPEILLKYKEIWDREFYNICDIITTQKTASLPDADERYVQQHITDFFNKRKCYFQDSYTSQYENGFFTSIKGKYISYTGEQDYSFIIPKYFKHLSDLCERIINTSSEEKWLIFVPTVQLGLALDDNLKQLDNEVDSVVIQAKSKTLGKRDLPLETRSQVAYRNIVQRSELLNRVTISTAVLDNGINIHDPTLKHIAILDMNRTSFLQMLGRKRIDRDSKEQISLYFWAKDIGEVKVYFKQSILRYIEFLIKFKFVQQFDDEQQMSSPPYIQNCFQFEKDYQENGSFKLPFSRYLSPNTLSFSRKKQSSDHIFHMYDINPLSVTRLTYDYYRFATLLEEYTNMSDKEKIYEKETHWLKYQLSWLGIEYDPKCWIDYPEHFESQIKLNKYLTDYEGKLMDKQTQKDFRETFITWACTHHPPLIKKDNKASISTINRYFQKNGILIKIKSFVVKRKTYWRIYSLPAEY